MNTAFWARRRRERSIADARRVRREESRDSEGRESEIEARRVLVFDARVSMRCSVAVRSLVGASLRRRERVVERHWFMDSSGAGGLCQSRGLCAVKRVLRTQIAKKAFHFC